MICPMMSKPITVVGALREMDYNEVHYVDCERKKCALWITEGKGYCGLIKE